MIVDPKYGSMGRHKAFFKGDRMFLAACQGHSEMTAAMIVDEEAFKEGKECFRTHPIERGAAREHRGRGGRSAWRRQRGRLAVAAGA